MAMPYAGPFALMCCGCRRMLGRDGGLVPSVTESFVAFGQPFN
jgi:hypothetical protein